MFEKFAFQRKTSPINIKNKQASSSALDEETARNRRTKDFNIIAETPDNIPSIPIMDDDAISDEELIKSAIHISDDKEEDCRHPKTKHLNQINQICTSSKNEQKVNNEECNGNTGKVDGKMKGISTGSKMFRDLKESLEDVIPDTSDDIIQSVTEKSDNVDDDVEITCILTLKSSECDSDANDSLLIKNNAKRKSKRKRVLSFNDSDSDVCSTPQKKHKQSTDIRVESSTKDYCSPSKVPDGQVAKRMMKLKGMFPKRTDKEILGAIKRTEYDHEANLLLANPSWTITDRKSTKHDTTHGMLNGQVKTETIEISDGEDDDDAGDTMSDECAEYIEPDNKDDDDDASDTMSDECAEYIEPDNKDDDSWCLNSSKRAEILSFLDDCSVEELHLIPGLSVIKANTLIGLRPFESWCDLTAKLNTSKGMSEKILQSCLVLLNTKRKVLTLMTRCEKISKDIEQLLSEQLSQEVGDATLQPAIINPSCKLKPYQLTGLSWLKLMHKKNMNSILADEMGLGKTIQALSFIAHLIEQGEDGPYLIIAPASTVDNWVRELKLWCPTVRYIQYYGSLEERIYLREEILSQEHQVIITTYQTVISTYDDRKLFRQIKTHYVIFDEGHMLKNMQSQRYQKLIKIKAKRRLLLTGTPLQNNLIELMSLLSFLMPQMFGDISAGLKMLFAKKAKNSSVTYEAERLSQAKRIMKPFVLRRLKKDVLSQLPQKTEEVVLVDLTTKQRLLYDKVFMECYHQYKKQRGSLYGKYKNLMMPLRMTSNHPLLLRNNFTDSMLLEMATKYCRDISHRDSEVDLVYEDMTVMSDFELHRLCLEENNLTSYALAQDVLVDCGKFNYLKNTLPIMREKGDRVLLFSQFTLVMDVIEVFLKRHKYRFLRLDGATKVVERQNLIDKFNNEPDIFIFLLSTKAGGLGINLTSANVVILHDIDFNPYNDKQAMDRCHRVGQTRDVNVYKLISTNTIEEAILRCAESKLKLEKDVVSTKDNEESESDVASILGQTFR